MKILITDIHHGNGGGHVTYVLNLLEGLKNEHDLTLASPPTGRLFRQASTIQGVRVLPGLYTSRPGPLLDEVRKLRRFLAHEKFDIVHVNGSADHRHIMMARLGLAQAPAVVWTKHNTNQIDSMGQRLRARFGTDAAIGVSEYVAAQLKHSAYGRGPIRAVYHGIRADFFVPPSAASRQQYRQQWFEHLPQDALVFGSTGGTDLEKGWIVLAEAAAALPQAQRSRVHLIVAGDSPSESVRLKLQALGLKPSQVVFPGLLKDVRPVLGASDIGFVLSLREAASYALYEAMSTGLPALVSDAGGLPEGVSDPSMGWIVPAGNVAALTQQLAQILETDAPTLAAMGASARRRIETAFTIPEFLKNTVEVYRLALDHRARRRGARG